MADTPLNDEKLEALIQKNPEDLRDEELRFVIDEAIKRDACTGPLGDYVTITVMDAALLGDARCSREMKRFANHCEKELSGNRSCDCDGCSIS